MKEFFKERGKQFYILEKIHFVLAWRGWKTTAIQILAPVFFLVALLILQIVPHAGSYTDPNPPSVDVDLLPKCSPYDKSYCYSLMYAPSDSTVVNEIMEIVSNKTDLPIVQFSTNITAMPSGSIVACDSYDQIIDFLWTEQNVTQAVLIFYPNITGSAPEDPNPNQFLEYNILYNGTCYQSIQYLLGEITCPDVRYALQRTVDQSLLEYITGEVSNIFIARKPYPIVTFSTANNDTVSTYGILFFYCGIMVGFVIFIYQIVFEKEKFLKQGMKIMGLKSSVYWTAWFVYAAILSFVSVVLMIMGGYACLFAFFLETNFFVLFFTFIFFSISMILLAFFVSTLVDTAKQAISIGMLLFIIGILIQLLLTNPFFLEFLYYNNAVAEILLYCLIFYPPFNFAKCISDITNLSYNYGEYKGPGYSWSDLYTSALTSSGVSTPPTIQSWYLLLLNCVIFAMLTWYFENIRAGNPILFFLQKDYWGIHRDIESKIDLNSPLTRLNELHEDIGKDIIEEDASAIANRDNPKIGLNVIRLSKVYKKYPFIKSKKDVHAQDNVSFTAEKGQLFCLLGHNGAGKTTTINILTGNFLPTNGDAFINGKSVLAEMTSIRKTMGVCPQHDILFEDLTAIEHLELYSCLKNIPREERKKIISEKLAEVALTSVGKKRVSSFSGGMKRRLSVAISSIGDPEIIFLDEPTTGMDPLSRRHVWELIEKMKKNRIIILTTHSMEEADVLSDKIAIMAHGKLRCIGNALNLKNRFGDGYRVNIMAKDVSKVEMLKGRVRSIIPDAKVIAESGQSVIFGINVDDYRQIVPLFRYLEGSDPDSSEFVDWGISQTTLEDVFLKITREVYSGGRRLDIDPYNG